MLKAWDTWELKAWCVWGLEGWVEWVLEGWVVVEQRVSVEVGSVEGEEPLVCPVVE